MSLSTISSVPYILPPVQTNAYLYFNMRSVRDLPFYWVSDGTWFTFLLGFDGTWFTFLLGFWRYVIYLSTWFLTVRDLPFYWGLTVRDLPFYWVYDGTWFTFLLGFWRYVIYLSTGFLTLSKNFVCGRIWRMRCAVVIWGSDWLILAGHWYHTGLLPPVFGEKSPAHSNNNIFISINVTLIYIIMLICVLGGISPGM